MMLTTNFLLIAQGKVYNPVRILQYIKCEYLKKKRQRKVNDEKVFVLGLKARLVKIYNVHEKVKPSWLDLCVEYQ